jgi:hypothetical protein
MTNLNETAEQKRLNEARDLKVPWKKWGPYLSERQWGTVREDYSDNGDAWSYFSHDQARSRAYHWGEDGLAGFSDEKQRLCFALALWNGRDPIIKERLFGLTNSEGNHGEDVKEYYFYLDSTSTHSYMKWLYKYPQTEYPYGDLVETNRRRSHNEFEYELIDTGVFNDDRYFDVHVGKNVFEGGFLGLDNIGVFDRSAPLPTGGYLEQADGTAWMALFAQNMLEIGIELAVHDSDYDDLAAKFADHFLLIAHAMNRMGPDGMWDEEDGFYYDLLRLPRWKRHEAQGPLHGGPAAPLCNDCVRALAEGADTAPSGALRHPSASNAVAPQEHPSHGTGTSWRGGAWHCRPSGPGQASPDPVPHARRERVSEPLWHPGSVPLPCRASLCL